jgi:hypothetical protein
MQLAAKANSICCRFIPVITPPVLHTPPTRDRARVVAGAQEVKVHLVLLHDLTVAQEQGEDLQRS